MNFSHLSFARQKLFTFAHNPRANEWQVASRDFKAVKQKLLFQLTNRGQPVIEVEDANFRNRSELLLRHRYDGVDLDERYGKATLRNLFSIWKRLVHIVMRRSDKTF